MGYTPKCVDNDSISYHCRVKFRRGSESVEVTSELPELLVRTLNSLETEALVVRPGDVVIYQSQGLPGLGLMRDGKIASEELLALIRVVRRTNEIHRGEIEVARGPVGEGKRVLKVSVSPLDENGIVLAQISDESEAKRIDAVRRDFVANVSHELKTPIGALGLLSEAVLGAKDQPEEVVRFATRMHQEAERLSELVQEIIDLSRLQSSDPLAKALPVDIDNIMRDAVIQGQVNAEARGVNVEVTTSDNGVVIGDREQLVAAVHNLIENAINYSPENTKVSVQSKIVDGLIEISVTDQGIGIAEEDLNRIFERFYRVDPARSRATGGTGLGLSIVKHVALNHGGDVRVWSKLGVGSTFVLQLPIAQSESEGNES